MSFDAQAECPSFFEDETNFKKDDDLNNTIISTSGINAKEDYLENIEERQHNLSIVKNGEDTTTQINQHYTQPYAKHLIKGKAMFSLHRHNKAGTIPCLAVDSLALETTFRMMKINFNVRYDIQKYYKPAYINHEGYLLTGIKKILHYLNLRSKTGIDSHLSPTENSIIRSFNMMLIDQTSFIVDFYRYYENYNGWKDVVYQNSNSNNTKPNVHRNIKNKKKSYKLIKDRMYCFGFYNWCEEGIKSVAKEDFRSLSLLLDDKNYFMGDIPCVLDCIAFAVISNLICSKHVNPLVTLLKSDFNNLIEHCERIRTLFWPDWDEQINPKSQSSSSRPKSFSYKRLSFRHKNRQSKSASIKSAKPISTSTTKDNKTTNVLDTAANESPVDNSTVDVTTTKEDIPNESITATNDKVDTNVQSSNIISSQQNDPKKKLNPSSSKRNSISFYKTFAMKCNFLRTSKRKKDLGKAALAKEEIINGLKPPLIQNVCICGSEENEISPTAAATTTTTTTNNNNNVDDEHPNQDIVTEADGTKNDEEQYADAFDDIPTTEDVNDHVIAAPPHESTVVSS